MEKSLAGSPRYHGILKALCQILTHLSSIWVRERNSDGLTEPLELSPLLLLDHPLQVSPLALMTLKLILIITLKFNSVQATYPQTSY